MSSPVPPAAAPPVPTHPRLIHARLLNLLTLARASGNPAYRRELNLLELHRRLIALSGNYEGLTSIELAARSGQDKAQISRAVKALAAAGLVERAGVRAKIRLTVAGSDMFDRIVAAIGRRNTRITRGIAEVDLDRFLQLTQRLTRRAALMLARERRLERGAGDPSEDGPLPEPDGPREAGRPFARLVIPLLIALTSYLQRNASITYRRDTGLPNFCWRTLLQIGKHQPLTLARLIAVTGRDKSQIGRAVRQLEESGSIERQVAPGRRDILLVTTAAGAQTYARMYEQAVAREEDLFAETEPEDRTAYIAVIEQLTANATAMLLEERARGKPA